MAVEPQPELSVAMAVRNVYRVSSGPSTFPQLMLVGSYRQPLENRQRKQF